MAAQSQLESHPLFLEAVESVLRCELAGLLSSDSYHPPAKPQMSTQDEMEDLLWKFIEMQDVHRQELKQIFRQADDFCARYLSVFNYGSSFSHVQSPAYSQLQQPFTASAGIAMPQNGLPSFSSTLMPFTTNNGLKRKSDASEISWISGSRGQSNSSDMQDERTSKRRRGNLPKNATEILRKWIELHVEHPYPTETEKQELVDATGLSHNQVVNWFINARRRVLPTLLEGSQPSEIEDSCRASSVDDTASKPSKVTTRHEKAGTSRVEEVAEVITDTELAQPDTKQSNTLPTSELDADEEMESGKLSKKGKEQ